MASDDEKMPDVDDVQEDTENQPEPNAEGGGEDDSKEVVDEGEVEEKPGDEGESEAEAKAKVEEDDDDEAKAEAEAEAPEPEHRFDDDEDDDDEDLAEDIPKAPPAPTPLEAKPNTQDEGGSQSQSQSQTVLVQRGTQRFTARYDRIVSGQGAAVEEARNWLTRVRLNGPRGVADILAVVISPAIGKGAEFMDDDLITQRTVMENEPGRSVKEVCKELEGESKRVAGLLVTVRRARTAFQEFWSRVASDCSDELLYETDCFDTLLSWLEAMSTAKLSILRHSACIAAYSMVEGFIDTGARLRSKLGTRQRQLQTEKLKCEKKYKKGAQVKYSKHYKRLSEEVDIMAANNGELIELVDKVFTGIFVLKYRDVAPEIRVISVEFLGRWIMKYPDHYLDDTHAKYIGWLLSDKDPGVRRACLTVLNDMLREPDFFQSLELFLRRFLSRIVEMCRDKDTDVAVRAIRICALLVPYDILSHEACDQLSDQMFEETIVSVRKAAGEFVAALITDPQDDTAPTTKRKRSRKKTDSLTSDIPSVDKAMGLLRELMNVCIRDDVPQMDPQVIIESIWDVMPAFRAWQAYANLLEEDDDSDEALPESHKALLCELLVHAAKIVVDSEPKPQPKSNRRTAAKETCSDALARIFTPLIPKLLLQYQGSSRILAALVRIPTYFSDVHFQEAAQKKHFLQLLHRLVGAISKHTGSSEVLNAASSTFKTMFNEMHPLNALAKQALAKAATETAKELRVRVASKIKGSDAVKVEASVLKAKVISELMELPEGTSEDVLAILDAILEKELPVRFNTNIAINALFVATGKFTWDALKASQLLSNLTGQDRESEIEEAETKLKNSFDEVVRRLVRLSEYPFALRVRERAAVAISSILFLRQNIMRSLNLNLDENSQDEGDSSIPLSDKAIAAVSSCLIDIIHSQWGLPARHSKVTSRYDNKKGKEAEVPEQDVHSFLLSLIQLTMKTAVPDRFLHLPFLGLLLNRRRGEVDIMDLSKRFLKLKIEDKHSAPHELARDALYVASDIKGGPRETKHFAVSQLARAFVEGTPDKAKSESFFANLLQALVDKCRSVIGDEANMRNAISILGKANAFLASRVTAEVAAPILADMRKLRIDLRDNEDLEKAISEELSMLVSPIIQQLDMFSSGEHTFRTPSSRRRVPRPMSKGGRRKKTKRRSDVIPWHGASNVNVESSQSLRRSGRTRKPRNLEFYDTELHENDDDFMEHDDDEDSNEEQEEVEEEVEEDDEAQEEEEELDEPPVTPVRKSKRRSKANDDENEEMEEDDQAHEDQMDEEHAITPSRRKKNRGKAKGNGKEENGLEEQERPTSRKRKRSNATKLDVRDEDEQESNLKKSKRRRSSATEKDIARSTKGSSTPQQKRRLSSNTQKDSTEESLESSSQTKRRRSSRLQGVTKVDIAGPTQTKRKRSSSVGVDEVEENPELDDEDDDDKVEEEADVEVEQTKANGRKKSMDEDQVEDVENSEVDGNDEEDGDEQDEEESEKVKVGSGRKRRGSANTVDESEGIVRRKKKRTW